MPRKSSDDASRGMKLTPYQVCRKAIAGGLGPLGSGIGGVTVIETRVA